MKSFMLFNYCREDDEGTHSGSATVKFKEDSVVLYSGGDLFSKQGSCIYDLNNHYEIPGKFIERIASFIPEEYKNESILSEYENANDFYNSLLLDSEKILFLCILTYFNTDHTFNNLLKMLKDNGIDYEQDDDWW